MKRTWNWSMKKWLPTEYWFHLLFLCLSNSQNWEDEVLAPNCLPYLPMLSVWKACWGRRKQVSTFWPVRSSKSVWNFTIGWAWFSDNHNALRFRLATVKGKYSNLRKEFEILENSSKYLFVCNLEIYSY